jgi:hypothetical protein
VRVAAGFVPDSGDAEASLRDVLAAALDANRELARLMAELREENGRLRAENAEQAAELGKLRADLVVLQRMAFGRSSERSRPEPPGGAGDAAGGQGAGITRTCPGSRCSGIFPGAGTAARNAGAVHAAGRSLVRGAAGLAGAAGGALPPPL